MKIHSFRLGTFPLFLVLSILYSVPFFTESQAQLASVGNVYLSTQAMVDSIPPYEIISGRLWITGTDITNLDSLYHITEIQEDLFISDANSLANIDGLSNLHTIGEELFFSSAPDPNLFLKDLDAFSNLTSVGTNIYIRNLDSLTHIGGLSGVTHANRLTILDCESLTNIDGLINVTSTEDELRIWFCPNLENIDGLANLTHVNGDLDISYLDKITNLDGLSSLTRCGGKLNIRGNDQLVNLHGLSNLDSTGYSSSGEANWWSWLAITQNALLPSLDGIHNLKKIGGGIEIQGNDLLLEIDALSQIDSVFGNIDIRSNTVLKDLYGLRNVVYYMGDIDLQYNDSLENCCGIYNYVNAVGVAVANPDIYSNGAGCTAADILANGPCPPEPVERVITGYSYFDLNDNCLSDTAADLPLSYEIVQALPGPYYGATDAQGQYELSIDTGMFQVSVLSLPSSFEACDTNVLVSVLPTDTIISVQDLGIKVDSCPDLTVDISGFWYRRCFPGNIQIQYCNNSLFPTHQVELFVSLPDELEFLSANRPHAYGADSVLMFDLGTLTPFQCGTITVHSQVSCNSVELLGITQCVEGWIASPDMCFDSLPGWSGASLSMEKECVNHQNQFLILNEGQSDMLDSVEYRMFADTSLVQVAKLLLNSGDSLQIVIPGDGQMYRMEVDQVMHHPTNAMLSAAIEGCDPTLNAGTSRGMLNLFPAPVRIPNPSFAIDCQQIIGAYDPNDKQVFPRGIGTAGLTRPGSRLQYLIRFQNTGNDTAFNIVISDTLSEELDMSTFRLGNASHPYRLEVSGFGRPILNFYFDNIQLPDSNMNEPASHGYIQFFSHHDPDAALGTQIENFADIYFDFNPPIRTNTVVNTLSLFQAEAIGSIDGIETTYLPAMTTGIKGGIDHSLQVFPNPAHDNIHISGTGNRLSSIKVEWMDIHGRIIQQSSIKAPMGKFLIQQEVPDIPPGLYLIRINGQHLRKIMVY